MSKQEVVEDMVEKKLDDIDDSLIDKIQASLNAINDKDADEDKDTDDQQTDDDDSTPDKNQAEDDDSTSDDEPDEDEDTDETGDTDDSKNDKATKEVQLPDAYYRAAIHQDWTPDEIKEFFEADPEKALKTLAKIHESTNKLNSEFARMGRIKPEDRKVADPGTATEVNAATSVDMDAIKEQYGDDSAIVKAMTIMQAKLDNIPEQQMVERVDNMPHNDPMRATVDRFFTDSALKPYEDFYGEGNDTEKLTQGQFKHRHDMLQMAEDIVRGSQLHGRDITVEAAMESAHLLVSEPVREAAIRKELKATVKKRAKGVTLKPVKSKAAKSKTGGPLTEKEMVAKVTAGLKKVYR